MNRYELIRSTFDKSMRLIELGASYNPVIPKSEGWQTTVIDHASQSGLIERYSGMGMADVSRIEPVDYVWSDGPLSALVPQELHGTFDGLIASHVGEHFPDLIAFLKSASALLKPDAVLALALPDKRVCFDFFQPITMTGDLVDAHLNGRTRHQRKTFFNQAAYFALRDGNGGWAHTGDTTPIHLAHAIQKAQVDYDNASEDPNSPYSDTHAWSFTPKSFELLVLELNLLGYCDWAIKSTQPAPGIEFFVWLEKRKIEMPDVQANELRLSLLKEMVRENADAVAQLDTISKPAPKPEIALAPVTPMPAAAPRPAATATAAPATMSTAHPNVAVVIPLYNGSKYIEEALLSVLNQTQPPAEIFVVNDGSTDNGAGVAIVDRIARTNPVTLLHKPNGGQSSARNLGVRECKSEFVAFLDQDDVWYDNHLEELVKPFEARTSPPLGWVYSNLDEVDEMGLLVSRSYLTTIAVAHPKRHIFDCIRQDMFILPSASLVKKEAFLAIGGFDERLVGYEDDDMFLRMFRAGYDNVFVDQALSKWRIYPGSTSYTFRMARSRAIYAAKLLELFPDDAKRARYFARDLIVPRFFDQAIREYEAAVKMGDPAIIAETWGHVTFLARHDKNVAPRMLRHALGNYKDALLQGDNATISAAWSEVAEVTESIPAGQRRRVRTALTLLKNPAISKSVFAMRRIARPAMLWAFSA